MRIVSKRVVGFFAVLLLSAILVGCASTGDYYEETPQPGLSVWPYLGICYEGSGCYQVQQFDLFVGIPASNISAAANCNDNYGQTATWYGSIVLVSGQLPPGLEFDYTGLNVVGVPTRAGTWHFRIRFTGVQCNGQYYDDMLTNYYQDVTIKTSGN